MLNFSVCPAVAEDAQVIAALNESCFGLSSSVQEVARQIKAILDCADERLLVAVYRGAMLGYIHLRVDRRTYRAPRMAVVSVAVDKEYRRKGVARALFATAEELALRMNCEAVSASVGGSRAAQAFFSAVGCEERLNRKQYIKWDRKA
ncbi:MAG: GNAT family N-acetyltransferase [Ruminococcaceae bacterium]|nr:GNAT family N-acetyltransferase [Oscillospiraceae bacterium]